MNVLIVEDDVDFRDSLIEILEIKGHEAKGIGSIAEFIALAHIENFDLIVVDLILQDGDGLEILRLVRLSSKTPVVLVTGSSQSQSAIEAKLSPDLFITKPFAVQPLLKYVEQLNA
jgi:DNA-binding response OmpR family regulator